ncbi:MAG: cysteine--tRNA ligase [Sphaerochaetaceae bacterium]|nr:cysteine--tRNA ligase [Sphaerochaetaceae bacterium]
MAIYLYNTMGREIQEFKPINDKEVGLYTCGPTVYNFAHIGNLRTFIFEDILKRVLIHFNYKVKHVMNITDVGHLTDDGDSGDDKMTKKAKESGKSVWEIASFYTNAFTSDASELNLIKPTITCKATDHIKDMINLIKRLEEGGHTYVSGGNVYFSIDTFPEYGKLANQNLDDLKTAVRDDVSVDANKKNSKDFVLWFTNSKFGEQQMMWDSPWGRGYPGWHIECSAMSMKYLGESFDIHCGGIDAIPVHHTNEIAQSEAATNHKWVNYWVHGEFLLDETGKMSKSKGDFLTLSLLKSKGYDPMDYRFFVLGGHYRSQLRFSFENLDNARKTRLSIVSKIQDLLDDGATKVAIESLEATSLKDEFDECISNNLNMPMAVAVLHKTLKSNLDKSLKYSLLLYFDEVFGLKFDKIEKRKESFPKEVEDLVNQRVEAKKARDFAKADDIRDEIDKLGYIVKDTAKGPVLSKKL